VIPILSANVYVIVCSIELLYLDRHQNHNPLKKGALSLGRIILQMTHTAPEAHQCNAASFSVACFFFFFFLATVLWDCMCAFVRVNTSYRALNYHK
jgi:hypothetical protein